MDDSEPNISFPDIDKLREFIRMLRAEGVQYIKQPELELILTSPPPQQVLATPAPKKDEEIPEVFKRLPGNYRHPALGLMKKHG